MESRRDFVGQVAGMAGTLAIPPSVLALAPRDSSLATATETMAALLAKKISAVELTKAQLARIEKLNPALNAIVALQAESALASARAADSALAKGKPLGPLHGLPITVKDTFEMTGVRTTAGFEPLKDHVSPADAVAVARLRGAGAVLLGHTNVPPLASDWQSDNPIYGKTKNPYDLARTPGGSSGGSAAALAAGLGYLSIGSDIGGSIRMPAAWTGIYGHKPTLNLVPFRGHIPPLPGSAAPTPTLPVAGPMARSADDLLLALRSLGGPDPDEAIAYRWVLPAARAQTLRGFRVGYALDHPMCRVLPEVREVLEHAVEAVRKAGATVTEGWPTGIDPVDQFETYRYLVTVAAFGGNLDPSKLEETRRLAASGGDDFPTLTARAQTDPVAVINAHEEKRIRARGAWQHWYRDHDVFLMPVAFTPAIRHQTTGAPIPSAGGDRPYFDLLFWIGFATLTGCPATSAPVGQTREGLPVGIQIMGPYLEDATPITFASRLAAVVGGFTPPKGYL